MTEVDCKPSLQSTLHKTKMENFNINVYYFPTSVGTKTSITATPLSLTTAYDGAMLLTTQGTHMCLILSLILHGRQVALAELLSPNLRRHMVSWSITRVAAGRSLTEKKSVPERVFPKKPAGTPCAQPWLVAVGGWRLAAVGG